MKKFKLLNPDQKKLRVILVISIIIGLAVQINYLIDSVSNGLNFNLSLFIDSFLLGLACAVGLFFTAIISLMEKEKSIF